ncbi:MAG: histidinol dehydrogenase [Pyrinomonadaceae bacterium]
MELAEKITNAGSVFIGNYSCESAGDYASGTNHTLPTGGFAKAFSGVSLDSFVKKITFQKLTEDGIRNLGRTVELMAEAEGLDAHKNAVSIRLETLKQVNMNFDLQKIVRENVKNLTPYSSARKEFSGAAQIFLDANENSFGSPLAQNYNRYPDPSQTEIKKKVAQLHNHKTV